LYSRVTTWFALSAAVAVGGLALWSWGFDQQSPLGAVGPNLFTSGLLAVGGLLLRRLRRR
jgi:hypothetical protein